MIGITIISNTEYLELARAVIKAVADLKLSKRERKKIARKAIKAIPGFLKSLR